MWDFASIKKNIKLKSHFISWVTVEIRTQILNILTPVYFVSLVEQGPLKQKWQILDFISNKLRMG